VHGSEDLARKARKSKRTAKIKAEAFDGDSEYFFVEKN
ncbi:hypothetical protein Tco_0645105, partial [Tanacetum coccineum]